MVYISFKTEPHFSQENKDVVLICTTHNLTNSQIPVSVIDAVKALSGVSDVQLGSGKIPDTGIPRNPATPDSTDPDVVNALFLEKDSSVSWDDLLPRIEETVLACLFPPGPPAPHGVLHSPSQFG